MPRYTITNFSRGEFAPVLYGRVDVPQYSAGAKEITNFLVQRYGGVSFRPGFRFVGEVSDISIDNRYVPFVFSNEQAYVMNLENEQFKLLAGGGMVTEDDLQITAITNDYYAQVTAAYHDLAVDDPVYFSGVEGMDEINGLFTHVVSVIDANNFTVDINTTSFGTFTSSDGIVRTGAVTPPPAPPSPLPDPPADPEPPTTTSPSSEVTTGVGTYGHLRRSFEDAIP